VAFVSYEGAAGKALKVVPASGGETRELLRLPGRADYSELSWTPDSHKILYAVSTTGQKPKFEFWRVSADGGNPENLGLAMEGLLPYGLSVHPGGRRIAFTAGTPGRTEVWVLKDFLPPLKPGK